MSNYPEQAAAESMVATEQAIDAALAEWFADNIRNSPVSHNTPAVNHLTASLPKLRAVLLRHITPAL